MPRQRVVFRERNDHLFIQQLKSVISLFARNESFKTDELLESRRRLVDDVGTITLLISDFSSRDDNFIQELKSLKTVVTSIVEVSTEILSSRNDTDFYDQTDFAYSAPKSSTRSGPGRKKFEISKDQIEHLRSLYFSWENIAKMLRISISTLQRRRKELGIDAEITGYTKISDEDLDELHRQITGATDTGLVTPNIGRRRFIGAL